MKGNSKQLIEVLIDAMHQVENTENNKEDSAFILPAAFNEVDNDQKNAELVSLDKINFKILGSYNIDQL